MSNDEQAQPAFAHCELWVPVSLIPDIVGVCSACHFCYLLVHWCTHREGEWGVGKAILESARRQGAKLTILELKKWYPEEMPKCVAFCLVVLSEALCSLQLACVSVDVL